MSYRAGVALVFLILYVSRRPIVRGIFGAMKMHPDYKAQMERLHHSYAAEESVVEDADWFGKTGLSEEDERELPKYLRREFGELLIDEDSLRAGDLTYLGSFEEGDARVHYWSVPSSSAEPIYAYIEVTASAICTGWGNREPPVTTLTSAIWSDDAITVRTRTGTSTLSRGMWVSRSMPT